MIGRPPHQPHRRLGDAGQALIAALEIGDRARNHVADVHRLARVRVWHQTLRGIAVLPIEHVRQGVRGAREGGMRGDVVDSLVAEPHRAACLAQPVQKLRPRPCSHDVFSPIVLGRGLRQTRARRSCAGGLEPSRGVRPAVAVPRTARPGTVGLGARVVGPVHSPR